MCMNGRRVTYVSEICVHCEPGSSRDRHLSQMLDVLRIPRALQIFSVYELQDMARQVDLGQEELRYFRQSVLRPGEEPVDDAVAD